MTATMPGPLALGLVPVALSWLLALCAAASTSMAATDAVPVIKVPADSATVMTAQVSSSRAELDEMLQEMSQLHGELEAEGKKAGGASWEKQMKEMETQLHELEEMLEALEAQEAAKDHISVSHDELKAEIERLRKAVKHIEVEKDKRRTYEANHIGWDKHQNSTDDSAAAEDHGSGDSHAKDDGEGEGHKLRASNGQDHGESDGHSHTEGHVDRQDSDGGSSEGVAHEGDDFDVSPSHATGGNSGRSDDVPKGRFDIDTEMPYGDLEPFGREDTAQELTEASIRESNQMVDQLERAEVAEEKRAVFRALTRLRGAAITSFDGVARSQTGNIDEYNKVNKWRTSHPIHHLANEESDVSKWAFPDNADF